MTNPKVDSFMRRAIVIGRASIEDQVGCAFAAVIIKDGQIVAEAAAPPPGIWDPTAHAEVLAIRAASQALKTIDLSDCEIYVTGAPCAMCAAALWWSRLHKVFYAVDETDFLEGGLDLRVLDAFLATPSAERATQVDDPLLSEARDLYAKWYAKPWYAKQFEIWTPSSE